MKKLILGLTMATLVSSVHMDMVEAAKDKMPTDYTKSIKTKPGLNDTIDAPGAQIIYGNVAYLCQAMLTTIKELNQSSDILGKDIKKNYRKEDLCSIAMMHRTSIDVIARTLQHVQVGFEQISKGMLNILHSDPRAIKETKFQTGLQEVDMGASIIDDLTGLVLTVYEHSLEYISLQKYNTTYHIDLRKTKSMEQLDTKKYNEISKIAASTVNLCGDYINNNRKRNGAGHKQLAQDMEKVGLICAELENIFDLVSVHVKTLRSYTQQPTARNNQELLQVLSKLQRKKSSEIKYNSYNEKRPEILNDVRGYDRTNLKKVTDKDKNYRDAPQLRKDAYGRDPYGGDVEDAEERRKLYQEPQDRNGFLGRIENSDRRLKDDDAESRSNRYNDPAKTTGRGDRKDAGIQSQPPLPSGPKADASWYDGGNEKYDNEAYRIKTAEQMGRSRYTEEAERRKDQNRK